MFDTTVKHVESRKNRDTWKVEYVVNETGLAEIKEFLSQNHKKGGDHFTRENSGLGVRGGVSGRGGQPAHD